MSSENNDLSTSEYKFTFRQTGSAFSSERHFSATSPETAREMFDFVCRKEDVPVDEVDLSYGIVGLTVGMIFQRKTQANPDKI